MSHADVSVFPPEETAQLRWVVQHAATAMQLSSEADRRKMAVVVLSLARLGYGCRLEGGFDADDLLQAAVTRFIAVYIRTCSGAV